MSSLAANSTEIAAWCSLLQRMRSCMRRLRFSWFHEVAELLKKRHRQGKQTAAVQMATGASRHVYHSRNLSSENLFPKPQTLKTSPLVRLSAWPNMAFDPAEDQEEPYKKQTNTTLEKSESVLVGLGFGVQALGFRV